LGKFWEKSGNLREKPGKFEKCGKKRGKLPDLEGGKRDLLDFVCEY